MVVLADKADMTFGDDAEDIARRIIHASSNQFGRSLELVADGLQEAAYAGASVIKMEMFADAYHRHTHCGKALNIFLAPGDTWRKLSPIKVQKGKESTSSARAASEKREDTPW
jgi:hypothetical protein